MSLMEVQDLKKLIDYMITWHVPHYLSQNIKFSVTKNVDNCYWAHNLALNSSEQFQ